MIAVAAIAAVIAGCGGSTKTVTVPSFSTSTAASSSSAAAVASTTTDSASADPAAKSACTAIIGDVPTLASIKGLGQYGRDVAKLMPLVSGSDQSTVLATVGELERLLGAVANGKSPANADLAALKRNAFKIGQICGRIVNNP